MSNPPIGELLGGIAALSVVEREVLSETVNERFKTSGLVAGGGLDGEPFNFGALARQVNYYALALADKDGKQRLLPLWEEMARLYDQFLKENKWLLGVVGSLKDDELRRLCSFSTRRQGSRTRNLYFGIVLFLVWENDRGALEDLDLFKIIVPAGERHFLEEVRRELAHMLNAAAGDAERPKPFPYVPPPRRAREHPEVALSFACKEEWVERFRSFFRLFSVGADRGVHLVLYRAREGCPNDVIKSFLALSPGRDDPLRGQKDIFRSLHFYQPPRQDWSHPRLSLGWIVPLEEGLYILSGQKANPERQGQRFGDAPRVPFRAIEALYFSWRSLSGQLLYGLAMSANNNGTPFITRVCARPTPIDHSTKLELGAVATVNLEQSLADDYERETAFAQESGFNDEMLGRFHLSSSAGRRRELASIIAHHCNNSPVDPRDWDIAPSRRGKGKAAGSAAAKTAIAQKLDDLVGSQAEAPSPIDGRPIGFWGNIRMGPLTNDGT